MYTQLYLKWVTYKDLLNSTGNSAQYYITTKMGKEFEKEYIHACVKKKKKKNQNLNLKKKNKKTKITIVSGASQGDRYLDNTFSLSSQRINSVPIYT